MGNSEGEQRFYQDVPQGHRHNEVSEKKADLVSSIGSVAWPPEKASFERAKGFVGEVIESADSLNRAISDMLKVDFSADTTRVCGRMVMSKNLIAELQAKPHAKYVETIIDLEGSGAGVDDCVLVYVGKNHTARVSPDDVVREEYEGIQAIMANGMGSMKQPKSEHFTFGLLTDEQKASEEILI
jgi:hypothetical protein